jgi:hypothetical protein
MVRGPAFSKSGRSGRGRRLAAVGLFAVLSGSCGGNTGLPVIDAKGVDDDGPGGVRRGMGQLEGGSEPRFDAATEGPRPADASVDAGTSPQDSAPYRDAPPVADGPPDLTSPADTSPVDVPVPTAARCNQDCFCGDGLHNGDETARDCGGASCQPCATGQACRTGSDCLSSVCGTNGLCATSSTSARGVALVMSDLKELNLQGWLGFEVGFRCKALVICGVNQTCHYSVGRLGSRQSSEATYYDGETLSPASAVRLGLSTGAASQCGNPPVKMLPGDFIELVYDSNRRLRVALPRFAGYEVSLYLAQDGSTYWDRELSRVAARPQP